WNPVYEQYDSRPTVRSRMHESRTDRPIRQCRDIHFSRWLLGADLRLSDNDPGISIYYRERQFQLWRSSSHRQYHSEYWSFYYSDREHRAINRFADSQFPGCRHAL